LCAAIAGEFEDPPTRRALKDLARGLDLSVLGGAERAVEHAAGAAHLLGQPALVDGRAEERR
jgi:hypothetical protein